MPIFVETIAKMKIKIRLDRFSTKFAGCSRFACGLWSSLDQTILIIFQGIDLHAEWKLTLSLYHHARIEAKWFGIANVSVISNASARLDFNSMKLLLSFSEFLNGSLWLFIMIISWTWPRRKHTLAKIWSHWYYFPRTRGTVIVIHIFPTRDGAHASTEHWNPAETSQHTATHARII